MERISCQNWLYLNTCQRYVAIKRRFCRPWPLREYTTAIYRHSRTLENASRRYIAMAERLETHQGSILPWLNAREHISATSCRESGPLHKPARKDEEHGGQPAPFTLVDQHEPFAQVARHAPFGQSDCGMGTGREASSHAEVRVSGSHAGIRAPGAERRGPRARARAPGTALVGGTLARGRTHQEPAPAEARLPACSTRRIARAQKKTPLRRAAPSPQTTDANQIRPES